MSIMRSLHNVIRRLAGLFFDRSKKKEAIMSRVPHSDAMKPFRFLDLPSELRNKVYRHLFESIGTSHNWDSIHRGRWVLNCSIKSHARLNLPSIIWTCHQLRREYLSLWLPTYLLRMHSLDAAYRWTTSLGPEFTEFAREVSIYEDPLMFTDETEPHPSNNLRLTATYSVSDSGNRTLEFTFMDGMLGFPGVPQTVIELDAAECIFAALCQTFKEARDLTLHNLLGFIEQLVETPLHYRLAEVRNRSGRLCLEHLGNHADMERQVLQQVQGPCAFGPQDQGPCAFGPQDHRPTVIKAESRSACYLTFEVMVYGEEDVMTESRSDEHVEDTPHSASFTSPREATRQVDTILARRPA